MFGSRKSRKSRKAVESTEFNPPQQKDFDIDLVIRFLIDVYHQRSYAEFLGSTITMKLPIGEQIQLACINFDNCRNDEERFWYSMVYLKYRGKSYRN
jgi:hypothetical protein